MSVTADFSQGGYPATMERVLKLGPNLSRVVASQWLHLLQSVADDDKLDVQHKKKWYCFWLLEK